jgi:hypothetical protein
METYNKILERKSQKDKRRNGKIYFLFLVFGRIKLSTVLSFHRKNKRKTKTKRQKDKRIRIGNNALDRKQEGNYPSSNQSTLCDMKMSKKFFKTKTVLFLSFL